MRRFVMTLKEFLLVNQMMYILDRECSRGLFGGPWLSRSNNDCYVILPTGRILLVDNFCAALYAHETAWENVEFSPEVIAQCESVTQPPALARSLAALLPNRSAGCVMRVESPV